MYCYRFVYLLFISILLISGCSPQATPEPTVIIPSETPPPPTPTPIPYDLTVTLKDADGAPLTGGIVDISGANGITDKDGIASFSNLPGETAVIKVSAPGYNPSEATQQLSRGANQFEVALELDPNGLLPVNACAADEKLLYITDFQDGGAHGWDALENKAPGWSVEPDPQNAADLVMAARAGGEWAWLGGRDKYSLNNAVWRMRFMYSGSGQGHMNFRFVESPDFTARYILAMGGPNAALVRWQPDNQFEIGNGLKPAGDEWHLLEYSYFDGTLSLYIDGKEISSWQDPNPWEGGTVNLEPNLNAEDVFYYDDISLCELSAPFKPIPRPKTGYNLAVTVNDEEGKPITNASITVAEMGKLNEATAVTDTSGKAMWTDLPGEKATLQFNVPGYFAAEEAITLEKGENEASLTLKKDPFGLLAAIACRPEETTLYVEDVQDGQIQGWNQLQAAIGMGAPGASIIPDPGQEGNTLLKFEGMSDNQHSNPYGYDQATFRDAVLRFKVQSFGNMHHIVAWHHDRLQSNMFYLFFIYGAGGNGGRLSKVLGDGGFVDVINWNKNIGDGKWHNIEISTYQGEVQLWIDGVQMLKWTDQEPVVDGYFTIEHDFWKAGSYAHYDDFSVCGLNAPFDTIVEK